MSGLAAALSSGEHRWNPREANRRRWRSEPMKALRVLLVEDDAMIGMLLADVLEEMGHVVCAIEGTQGAAVTAAAHHRPDLMIVDARLGHGSGISAVEQILRARFVPHLFITGNILRVQELRPDAVVLEKPFREAALMHAIQRALDIAAIPLLAEPT
jgi:two-component system, response regulator PdtaR